MTQALAFASYPVADSGPGEPRVPEGLDVIQTVLSQYANSPVMLAVLSSFADALIELADFERFYNLVWNIDTAKGFGLDVWGRIVGVGRVLDLPVGGYLGFDQAGDAKTFGQGIWYGKGVTTTNFALSDNAFRLLILAKAALNITDGSIAATNRILMALFPDYGNCYVRDNNNMTITYVFGDTLSAADLAIVTQSGVLPRGAGVTANVEQP